MILLLPEVKHLVDKEKLTGVFAGGFSLLSLLFFLFYNDKKVTEYIDTHTRKEQAQ